MARAKPTKQSKPRPYHERVVEKRSYSFANGWGFDLVILDDRATLNIPVTGWGGYGGPASREQEAWVEAHTAGLDGVEGEWMGCWRVELSAVDALHELMSEHAEHVGVYPRTPRT